MARRIGCKTALIIQYERGDRVPDVETFHQYHSLDSVLKNQRRQNQLRPLADSLIQEQNLQQIDTDQVE